MLLHRRKVGRGTLLIKKLGKNAVCIPKGGKVYEEERKKRQKGKKGSKPFTLSNEDGVVTGHKLGR